MLNVFAGSNKTRHAAERLYTALVVRSREPVFFARLGVPDTFDGRFDLFALHAWTVLACLGQGDPVAQALVNRIFAGFDEALREQGAGDIGMSPRIKKMASAFYGRLKAYDAAPDEAAMRDALVRNLYRGNETAAAGIIATYISRARAHLAAAGEGEIDFGPLPGEEQA